MWRGAPGLTFLSQADSGSAISGAHFQPGTSARANASGAEEPAAAIFEHCSGAVATPRGLGLPADAKWRSDPSDPAEAVNHGSWQATSGNTLGSTVAPGDEWGSHAEEHLTEQRTEAGLRKDAELDMAEHGLAGRQESEILTQAAVDAMRPQKSAARRPSVVQFTGLEAAMAAVAGEAGWGPAASAPQAKPRFQAAGKMAMAALTFQQSLGLNKRESFQNGGSDWGGPPTVSQLPASISWRIKIRAALALRVANRKSLLGEGAMMKGRSLGHFSIANPYRLAVFKLLYSKPFEYMLFCVIALHLVTVTGESGQRQPRAVFYALDLVALCFYMLEAAARIFALGLWQGETAYLRSNYNCLDFLVVLSSCALKIVRWRHVDQPIFPGVLRAFRAVLCLRTFSGIGVVIATLECTGQALPQLGDVFLFTGMAALLFGLAGVQLFSGSFRRGCVLATGPGSSNWTQANPPWLCGTITSPGSPELPASKGYVCPAEQGQFCTAAVGDPNYGNTGLDNLGEAALLMIQTLSYESWEYNMWDNIDAEYQYASIYYILFILLGPFVLVNVFVAAISSVYLQLRRRNQILLEVDNRRRDKRRAWTAVVKRNSTGLSKQDSSDSRRSSAARLIKSFLPKLARSTSEGSQSRSFTLLRFRSGQVRPAWGSFGQGSVVRSLSGLSAGSSEAHSVVLYEPSTASRWHARWLAWAAAAAKPVVSSQWFRYLTGLLVLGNFLVMCFYKPGEQSARSRALHTAELVLAGVFVGEALLRIAASGVLGYFRNAGEVFDFAIVLASLAGLASGKFPNLNMARIFRYIRALGRNKRGRETVIFRLLCSWGPMLGLFSFFFLVVSVFAVFAMQLFGGRYDRFTDGKPRSNFDTFPQAWLSIFQVTSSDQWMSITWGAMRLQWSSALFFSLCWTFSNVVVLNLVIALVLDQFRLKDSAKLAAQRKETLKAIHTAQVSRNLLVTLIESVRVRCVLLWRAQRWSLERAAAHSPYFAHIAEAERTAARHKAEEGDFAEKKGVLRRSARLKCWTSMSSLSSSIGRTASVAAEDAIHQQLRENLVGAMVEDGSAGRGAEEPSSVLDNVAVIKRPAVASVVMKREYGKRTQYHRGSLVVLAALQDLEESSRTECSVFPRYMRDRSMGFFTPESRARQLAILVTESFWYRWVSMGVIGVSIVAVIWTPNSSQTGPDTKRNTVRAMNLLTAIFFAVDAIMKMTAKGVILTPTAYFQDAWNWMDFFLLLVDLLRLRTYSGQRERALRAITALRGARVMIRQPSIRELMTALIKTMGPVATLFLLAFVLFVIFAMLAIRLFGDKLYYCNDSSIRTGRQDCFGNFVVPASGIYMPRVWTRPDYNYDSLGKGVLTLFELGTLDNWGDALFAAMDITGLNKQPRRNAEPQNAIFFVVFICVSAHFMIKSFVAVFCEQFQTITGNALLTEKQKTWQNITKTALQMKPVRLRRPPTAPFKKRCFCFVESWRFTPAIVLLILVNIGFLASYSYGQSSSWNRVLNIVDCCFTAVYVLEVLLKWQAAGSLWQWVSYWNAFEAVLAIGSIATVFPTPGTTRAAVSRPFGFVRILRVVRYSRGMRSVAATLLLAGRAMLTILSSIGIVAFAYAGIGVQIFASVKYGLSLNRQVNFQGFSNSFLLLFQVLTGENWRYTMNDVKTQAPYCTEEPPPGGVADCGTAAGATIFFVTFVILNSYLLSNLFVAAILEIVASGLFNRNALVTPRDLETFQKVWAFFDPQKSGFIGLHDFRKFLAALKRARCPLASKAMYAAWERPVWYEAWHVRAPHKGLPFADTMLLLLHDKFGRHALTYDLRKERERDIKDFMEGGAAAVIQAHARGYLTRKRITKIKARRADPRWRKQRRHRSRSPEKQGKKQRSSGSSDAATRDGQGAQDQAKRAAGWSPTLARWSPRAPSDSRRGPSVGKGRASARLTPRRSNSPAWPERREEPSTPCDSPYEINGRPVLGSLEVGDGPAPSGLLSGQPRRPSPRLGAPRPPSVPDPRTETAAFGVDRAMSFRLPEWARQQIESERAVDNDVSQTTQWQAWSMGGAEETPAGQGWEAGPSLRSHYAISGKSARGSHGRAGSGLGNYQQHPLPEELAGSGGLTEVDSSLHPETRLESAPSNANQPLEGTGSDVQC